MSSKFLSEFLVAPSILSADFAHLAQEIKNVEDAGADFIHVDVMDGHFVPNLTIGAPVVKALYKVARKPLDVHLMIDNPQKYFADFQNAGAHFLTVHIESLSDPIAPLKDIRTRGMRPGLTLRPQTPIESVLPYLQLVDLVLVMTVEPGFGGQTFMVEQVEKIKTLRQKIKSENLNVLIEVDGGVNPQTAQLCKEADILVAGSAVFKGDYRANIQTLKKAKV